MAIAVSAAYPAVLSPERAVAIPNRRLWSLAVVLLLAFAANQFAAEWILFRSSAYPAGDFAHYYLAAKLAGLSGQHRLYSAAHSSKEAALGNIAEDTEWGRFALQNGLHDTLHFSAPPVVAWMLIPLGKLPLNLAFLVWRIFSEICFFLAICGCLRLFRAFNPVPLLLCALAGFAFQPFTLTLEKGQFGALLLLLWAGGTLLAQKKQDTLSALMFALATVVKLTPVLAVGVFLVRRRWKWAAAYALWMVLLVGLGVWRLGMENHRLYLSKLQTLSCGVPGPYNYSLAGIVQNAYYGDVLSYDQIPAETPAGLCAFAKLAQLGVYLGVLIVLLRRNRNGDVVWDMAVLSLAVLLLAPFTWRHYYVLELLPLMFVWFYGERFLWPNRTLVVTVVCTLIAATRYPDYLQVHLTNGPLRVFLVGMLPLSALALMLTLLFSYRPEWAFLVLRLPDRAGETAG
jgi:hypothetical protein